jgi:hypothetical protein
MGFYIECPSPHGKAGWIVGNYQGEMLSGVPASYRDIPEGKALIVVVDNEIFEAAGFCSGEQEFAVFADPQDLRPKMWLLIGRTEAELASGYHRPAGSFPDYSVQDPQAVKDAAALVKASARPGETSRETVARITREGVPA